MFACGGKAPPLSTTGRALAIPTGHPALKLVLLVVAACPGWPAVDDVAELSELGPEWAADALAELVRRGQLIAHSADDGTRFSLPDDGWTYTRSDVESPDEVPADAVRKAIDTGEITGAALGRGAGVQP